MLRGGKGGVRSFVEIEVNRSFVRSFGCFLAVVCLLCVSDVSSFCWEAFNLRTSSKSAENLIDSIDSFEILLRRILRARVTQRPATATVLQTSEFQTDIGISFFLFSGARVGG